MSNTEMMHFGQKLYTLRIQRQMTLKELAMAVGHTAHGYISELEAGKKRPTVELVIKLAHLFGVTTDQLLRDEVSIADIVDENRSDAMNQMTLAFIDRPPTTNEIQRLRLILSTFQDGTGQLASGEKGTLPGWRDFERAVALTCNGIAQENKAVFDVLVTDPVQVDRYYGISCKMRRTLNDVDRTGHVTLELSNSASKFWKALSMAGFNQNNYRQNAEQVGQSLIDLVSSWHQAASQMPTGYIDLTKSFYLVLSWNSKGDYQLHQFPLHLPTTGLNWYFPAGEARLRADNVDGRVFEWYGESGGQLKYYPSVSSALWKSDRFQLEPLPSSETPYGLLAKAAAYFPKLWSETSHSK